MNKIIMIKIRDGLLEIHEKIGENSYDCLHIGTINDPCKKRFEALLGSKRKEFIIEKGETDE